MVIGVAVALVQTMSVGQFVQFASGAPAPSMTQGLVIVTPAVKS